MIAHQDTNFRVRFCRLSVLQQKHLRAMAELGHRPNKTGRIAATLGVATTFVATVRQQWVNKGLASNQRHCETAFTVPLFDSFNKTTDASPRTARAIPLHTIHMPQLMNVCGPQRSPPS